MCVCSSSVWKFFEFKFIFLFCLYRISCKWFSCRFKRKHIFHVLFENHLLFTTYSSKAAGWMSWTQNEIKKKSNSLEFESFSFGFCLIILWFWLNIKFIFETRNTNNTNKSETNFKESDQFAMISNDKRTTFSINYFQV